MIRLPPISTLFPYPTLFRSLIPPDVPRDTRSPVVISRGGHGENEPISVAQVSALAAARAPAAAGQAPASAARAATPPFADRKSTRLNSSHGYISYAVFCLKK